MRVLVYGPTQWEGQNVEIEGEDYRVLSVETAPEAGYDGLNQWEGPGGTYSVRAHWVTVEPLSPEESKRWAAEQRAAFDKEIEKDNRPWWRLGK